LYSDDALIVIVVMSRLLRQVCQICQVCSANLPVSEAFRACKRRAKDMRNVHS